MFTTHWNASEKQCTACLSDLGFKVGTSGGRGTYEGAFLRWGRRHAEIAEDADEALKATVGFAYPWRGGSELGEVGEGVEEWQRRCTVEG